MHVGSGLGTVAGRAGINKLRLVTRSISLHHYTLGQALALKP